MISGQAADRKWHFWPFLSVPLMAFLLVLPLLPYGPSCGHDFGFHMQSWMDAGEQIRHGTLLPRWAYSPAFNAGEPRFIFYPPLSWLLGSLLLIAFPAPVVPALFTLLAFTLAGWGMVTLARRVTSPAGALLASAIYLCNPYLLFTAFERTAYAELLASAWMPWLLRAAFAETPSPVSIGVPLALLWLTNAPAAVMGTYTLVFVLLLRLLRHTNAHLRTQTGWLGLDKALVKAGLGGLSLGLALPAFYLVPAAYERRYVQIAMAIIPNMRIEDNFLFGHTGYGPHDQVLHTASLVAVSLLTLTAIPLALLWLRQRRRAARSGPRPVPKPNTLVSLTALAFLIAVLLMSPSVPLWHHLPEMAFLQFPWRLLAVLGCVFAFAVALCLDRARVPIGAAIGLSLLLAAAAAPAALVPFREGCDAHELPRDRVALYAAHHGVGPTDEYTPGDADNDQLRWDDPAWWLATSPSAPGPNTVPNPAATITNYDEPPPLDQTVSGRAPFDLRLSLAKPADLVLNLRDYPAWQVTVNGQSASHLQRDDGLIALALPAGTDTLTVRWHSLPDMWLGAAISLCAIAATALLGWRSRRIKALE